MFCKSKIFRKWFIYCTINFLSFFLGTAALELPPIACPQYFRYEQRGNKTVGILSPQSSSLSFSLSVTFSVQGVKNSEKLFSMEPFRSSSFIEYLVHFHNSGSVPKLVEIERDDDVVCEAEPFPQPSYLSTEFLNGIVKPPESPKSLSQNNSISTIPDVHRFDECGFEGLVPFQYGGVELERGRFPWISALYLDSSTNPTIIQFMHKCSATLVSLRSVITAAHCVFKQEPSKIRVYVGRYNLRVFPENGAMLKEIEKIRTHPDYTHHIVPEADVAILTFTTPVIITGFIRPICIWRSSDKIDSENNESGSVAGWGIDEKGQKPKLPRLVDVNTVSQVTCLSNMIGAEDYLTERTICAGNSDHHGPCLGDSGGGLMIKRNNRWLLRAVVSLGPLDKFQCDNSKFVIYCDLAKHIDWVQENVI